MDELEAAARALFAAKSPHADWDTLDGHTKEVFRARARTNAAEAAPAPCPEPCAPPAAEPPAPVLAADPDELPFVPSDEDGPKPKKSRGK